MKNIEQIDKLIEEALNSADDVKRAEPKPFLLTRINARISRGRERETVWERAGRFIARPAVAFTGLCMVLMINVMVVMLKDSSTSPAMTELVTQAPEDEFSYTVATTIYDIENPQP